MTRLPSLLTLTVAVVLTILGSSAITAQDTGQAKYSVQVPDGLSFSEFRGYEDWQVVAVSQSDDILKAIVANPVMIEAYRAGIPRNGKPFPDGSRIAKIMWKQKTSTDVPSAANVPDTLKYVDFIVKDSTRFAAIGGWGYAQFNYDRASDRFTPDGTGVQCGTACHTIAKAKDYIFTEYGKR